VVSDITLLEFKLLVTQEGHIVKETSLPPDVDDAIKKISALNDGDWLVGFIPIYRYVYDHLKELDRKTLSMEDEHEGLHL